MAGAGWHMSVVWAHGSLKHRTYPGAEVSLNHSGRSYFKATTEPMRAVLTPRCNDAVCMRGKGWIYRIVYFHNLHSFIYVLTDWGVMEGSCHSGLVFQRGELWSWASSNIPSFLEVSSRTFAYKPKPQRWWHLGSSSCSWGLQIMTGHIRSTPQKTKSCFKNKTIMLYRKREQHITSTEGSTHAPVWWGYSGGLCFTKMWSSINTMHLVLVLEVQSA